MKHPIKLLIQQKYQTKGDWIRYKTVSRILIDDYSSIKTEAQLCKFIYDNFGIGRYMCLAYQKGVSGFWRFWFGDILENGFVRDINKNKEVEELKFKLKKADSYEEREEIEEEINLEEEIGEYDKKYKRRGPIGLIAARPGILQPYQEY